MMLGVRASANVFGKTRDFAFDFHAFMVYTLGMEKKYTTLFQKMLQASEAMGETDDCAVISVAIVGGLTYKDAHNLLERAGRKPRESTDIDQAHQSLKLLNIKTRDVTKQYRDTLGAKTIRTLSRVMADRKGVYLALTHDHSMAIKDGVVHDWCDGGLYRIVRVLKLRKGNTND